jgi:hypothetical protein
MARSRNNGNGRADRLQESFNSLVQAQAALVQSHALLEQAQAAALVRQAETDARWAATSADMVRIKRESDERFARIEAILLEHGRILRALPDAIREKIGFKIPAPQATQ